MNFRGLFITSNPLPMRKYILRMALISLLPSILLAIVVGSLAGGNAGPDFEENNSLGPFPLFLGLVIFSPLAETLLLSLGIGILSRFLKSAVRISLISALIWAIFHSLFAPLWGIVVFWPFVVFSCAYLTWRRYSWLKAVWAAFCIHMLQNLLPGLLLLIIMSME